MGLMKKDLTKTAVFALMVSIVVVFSVLEIKKFQDEENVKEVENRVVAIGSSEVEKVAFDGYTLKRDRKNFTWKLVSPYTDYLNYRLTEEWVAKGLSQEGRNLSEKGERVNWQNFSLDHDDHKITYTTISGEKASVQLSKKEAFDGSTYLRVSSKYGEQLYSSGPEWKKVFSKKIESLRAAELFNWETPSPSSLLRKIEFYKKGKIYLNLEKTSDKWRSKNFETWTFEDAKVDSYVSELKTYLYEDFAKDRASLKIKEKVKLKNKLATIVVGLDTNESYSLGFYKGQYAVASYRPEHILKVDDDALSNLMVDPLDLRSFEDVDGGVPNGDYSDVKIKINNKSQLFRFKDGIWILRGDEKGKKTFNGARVFIFLDKLKKINFRRYVSKRGIIFKSAKKRIYLLKGNETINTYSIGQTFPCEKSSKRNNCVLVATKALKNSYIVALKKEVNEIFRFSFRDGAK